jgi:hypothetical protein
MIIHLLSLTSACAENCRTLSLNIKRKVSWVQAAQGEAGERTLLII